MKPLFILLLIGAMSSPAFALASDPNPNVHCSGWICWTEKPPKPPKPAKPKFDNQAIDAGMEEAGTKADIARE